MPAAPRFGRRSRACSFAPTRPTGSASRGGFRGPRSVCSPAFRFPFDFLPQAAALISGFFIRIARLFCLQRRLCELPAAFRFRFEHRPEAGRARLSAAIPTCRLFRRWRRSLLQSRPGAAPAALRAAAFPLTSSFSAATFSFSDIFRSVSISNAWLFSIDRISRCVVSCKTRFSFSKTRSFSRDRRCFSVSTFSFTLSSLFSSFSLIIFS